MKIRIKGNSLRWRLSKSEVDLFYKEGYLEEKTEFGNTTFLYAVKSTGDVETLSAAFTNNTITLLVSKNLLQQWSSTNMVSINYDLPVGDENYLHLLLEKDFKCIDAVVTEDQSDYFENPFKAC